MQCQVADRQSARSQTAMWQVAAPPPRRCWKGRRGRRRAAAGAGGGLVPGPQPGPPGRRWKGAKV